MARGFVYLAVVLDWFSRRVLSWRLSITMEAAFCVETLEDALACHGKPEIFNTDQGSQFTGAAFTGVIKNGIAISMDGKGAWRDNIFVERRCGTASNTRRCICGATTASARPALRSPTRALTARHPIKLTSPRCHSAWQPNPGRGSTYRRGKTVQTTETTLDHQRD
jgi:putative transposase